MTKIDLFMLILAIDLLAFEFCCRCLPHCVTEKNISEGRWLVQFWAGKAFATLFIIAVSSP